MDLVAGALGNLVPKLLQLLQDEYKLHTSVKRKVKSLADELEAVHLALCKVADVPYDELDPQVKLWASQAREASYDMEDTLDNFFVHVDGCHQHTDAGKGNVRRVIKKMRKKFSRLKARHDIAGAIEKIMNQVEEMTKRRDRYKVDDVLAKYASRISIDPRIWMTLRTKTLDLVGIDEPKNALIKMLTLGDDDASDKNIKIVSVVGSGGLGKTTLAKVVYDKVTIDMNIFYKAFVPVGQNPDLRKVLRDILLDLDKPHYTNKTDSMMIMDERQLIGEIQAFLKEKRYFIVIDDVWDVPSWNWIRTAFEDNNPGSKILITTRYSDVAGLTHHTYKIQPLPPESSKILFYGRLFGSQDNCPESCFELSDKILKKCGGVPLAIVTIASLLANKSDDNAEWQEVCNSIGFGLSRSSDMYNDMRKILSLSYYDLPSHMKACFLYLSMYPEDYLIRRDQLILRWICEGFIKPQRKGDDLFKLGKNYFNDLINRSLILPIKDESGNGIYACRVHDMILDLICSLSREENFVTTSYDIENGMSLESRKVRRLSIKNNGMWPKQGVAQVRSIGVFGPSTDSMPSFSCFNMLRVLELEGCSPVDCASSILCIGNLVHLRYLRLFVIERLHEAGSTGRIQYLELPESIFGLRRLMCLEGVLCCPRQGSHLENLVSLQVLDKLCLNKDPTNTLKALGHLTGLTKLEVDINCEMVDQSICDTFIDTMGNLSRLQYLNVYGRTGNISYERWTPPPHLRHLSCRDSWIFPKWISPAMLPYLTNLYIFVPIVRPENIQILGTLPNLVDLQLGATSHNYSEQPLQKFEVSADAFPCLRECSFESVVAVPSMFTRGAMPRVSSFVFSIRATDFFSNHAQGGLDFDDLVMDHLPSVQYVACSFYDMEIDEDDLKKLRAAVKHAADVHPNHPKLRLFNCRAPRYFRE